MTAKTEPGLVTRERRLANLRATLGRSASSGGSESPARPPIAGRRPDALPSRLAAALGGEVQRRSNGTLVMIESPPTSVPLDRHRLARLPGHPAADVPLLCLDTETTGLATAAGTLAFLVGLGWWEGDVFRQLQLLLPDHADEPAMLDELRARIPDGSWLVTYNGRGFDWPLLVARYRMAGWPPPRHAGHLDLLSLVRRVFRHRLDDARLRTVETELLGIGRHADVGGWEIPSIYLDVLKGGPIAPLGAVVRHNEADVRALATLLSHVERGYVERSDRQRAPRGDLAGLARAYVRERRELDALDCLDDALVAPSPARDPFGAAGPPPSEPIDDAWWSPGTNADFGGSAATQRRAGWRSWDVPVARPARTVRPGATAWDGAGRWSDERIVAERARILRRLGRYREAAEAWEAAAAAGGGIGVVAWIEVAKLREHRLRDPQGALVATQAAWHAAERSRRLGRPLPHLESDLLVRGRRLRARVERYSART
ncbi:MAG: ribonuclease H-like domain-containing protein [Chloroflexota bacterium]